LASIFADDRFYKEEALKEARNEKQETRKRLRRQEARNEKEVDLESDLGLGIYFLNQLV
jgi:hypothetical protein